MLRLFQPHDVHHRPGRSAPIYQSPLPLEEVLSILPPQAHLVLRSPSLTLSKHLAGGIPDGDGDLSIEDSRDLNTYLFPCPQDRTLVVKMRTSDPLSSLTFRFSGIPWTSAVAKDLLRCLQASAYVVPALRRKPRKATSSRAMTSASPLEDTLYLLSLIDEASVLHARVTTRFASLEARFRTVFIDLEETTIRLADRSGQHAVFLHSPLVACRLVKGTLHLESNRP
ncbi:MAG: hypothetical protein ACQKBU_05620 [Verrucomicrobiales bacterium]